jgi:hypothetical protein
VKCLDLYGLVKLAGFDPDFLDQIGSLKSNRTIDTAAYAA